MMLLPYRDRSRTIGGTARRAPAAARIRSSMPSSPSTLVYAASPGRCGRPPSYGRGHGLSDRWVRKGCATASSLLPKRAPSSFPPTPRYSPRSTGSCTHALTGAVLGVVPATPAGRSGADRRSHPRPCRRGNLLSKACTAPPPPRRRRQDDDGHDEEHAGQRQRGGQNPLEHVKHGWSEQVADAKWICTKTVEPSSSAGRARAGEPRRSRRRRRSRFTARVVARPSARLRQPRRSTRPRARSRRASVRSSRRPMRASTARAGPGKARNRATAPTTRAAFRPAFPSERSRPPCWRQRCASTPSHAGAQRFS